MNRPLDILALNWRCDRHPQAGGSEANLFEQARRWARDGHRVTVFCADPGRKHAPHRDEDRYEHRYGDRGGGLRVVRRGGRFTVYPLAALYVLLNARLHDAVLDVANGVPFFAPLFTGRPVVLLAHHVHGRQWFEEFPRPLAAVGWFLERRVVPLLYRRGPVIAVSETTREALAETGFDPDRIRVVHNGVATPEERIGRYSGEPRIAYVGRVKRYKRLDRLVRMIPVLREEFPDVHLDLAGTGDAVPGVEALIEALGLRGSITVHGFVGEAEKAAILSRATVFATPSMHEGWGLTVIEANALGCPAVAYDVPGLRAAIRHGETGLLAQDDAGFREALALFLRDRETRRRHSRAARRWAAGFSWEACARQTLQILLAAAGARSDKDEPERAA